MVSRIVLWLGDAVVWRRQKIREEGASERVHLSHISCSVYLLVVVRSDFSTDSSIEEYLGLRRSTYVARPNPSILPFFPSLFPAFFLSFFRFFLLSFFAVWRISAPQEPKKSLL